jgi:hypothetical protein
MTFVSGFEGMSLKGNCSQNFVDPFPPYFSSLGMLGFFGGPSVLAGSGGVVADDDAKSQNITIDHFAGRPRSALDAGVSTRGQAFNHYVNMSSFWIPFFLCCFFSYLMKSTVSIY